jgi:hypothetical protein
VRALSEREALQDISSHVADMFHQLADLVPRPQSVSHLDGYKLQYLEKSVEQLVLLKCARQIAGFNALLHLLDGNHLQDQAAVQRILDEIHDDILFIYLGKTVGPWTRHHDVYVSDFWSDIDDKTPRAPRDKIVSYISQRAGSGDSDAMRTSSHAIHRAYSSYVHANATATSELYDARTGRFSLNGILDPSLIQSHRDDAWNYAYRIATSLNLVALLIDPDRIGQIAYSYLTQLENRYPRQIFG